jgi:hypothetical protein
VKLFREGEGIIHGWFANRQPPEAVQAVLRENIRGLKEEMRGLRELERGLLELQMRARKNKEAAQLANAYTLTAARLVTLMEAEKKTAKSQDEDSGAVEFFERLDELIRQDGRPPDSVGYRERARQWKRKREGRGEDLREEAAATRYILRTTLERAKEAEAKGDVQGLIHLCEIYSMGCNRLVRLLRSERDEPGVLREHMLYFISEGIRRANKEMGIIPDEHKPEEAYLEHGGNEGIENRS